MPTNVFADETAVVPLLTQMRLPRWVLLEMAEKIGGERANVAAHEPHRSLVSRHGVGVPAIFVKTKP